MRRRRCAREARGAFRVLAGGIGATCRCRRLIHRYRVRNLSTRGILLEAGEMLPVGERIDVRLSLPHEETIDLAGHVVRYHAEGRDDPVSIAVAFDDLAVEQSDAIHDVVVDIILRDWKPGRATQPGSAPPRPSRRPGQPSRRLWPTPRPPLR